MCSSQEYALGEWSNALTYYNYPNFTTTFDGPNLFDQLSNSITNSRVLRVKYVKNPLTWIQLTQYVFYHVMLVLHVEDERWYSVEKNMDGIIIQQSFKETKVMEEFADMKRLKGLELFPTHKSKANLSFFLSQFNVWTTALPLAYPLQ